MKWSEAFQSDYLQVAELAPGVRYVAKILDVKRDLIFNQRKNENEPHIIITVSNEEFGVKKIIVRKRRAIVLRRLFGDDVHECRHRWIELRSETHGEKSEIVIGDQEPKKLPPPTIGSQPIQTGGTVLERLTARLNEHGITFDNVLYELKQRDPLQHEEAHGREVGDWPFTPDFMRAIAQAIQAATRRKAEKDAASRDQHDTPAAEDDIPF